MKTPLKPVKPRRISDQVFDQLKELIVRGQLKPGEQLMPERELAETLGVSRTTVRDAISKLVVMGYLEHRQGQGTFVRKPTLTNGNLLAEAMRFEDATLKDLLEFRKGLECNAAAVGAHRAMDDDIDMLRKTRIWNERMKTGILVRKPMCPSIWPSRLPPETPCRFT